MLGPLSILSIPLALTLAVGDVPTPQEGPLPSAVTVPPPVVATLAAPSANPPPTDRPEQPRYKGIGLLATTAVLSGTALALTLTRIGLLVKNCPVTGSMPASQCTYDFGSDIGLAATAWAFNIAAVGFAPGAGVMMARHDAWRAATGAGPKRNPGKVMGIGGGLLGAGIVGLGTAVALSFVLTKRCVDIERESSDPLSGDKCLLRSFPAWTITNWASFAMIAGGAGMLAYGTQYKRRSARYSLRVAPYGGPRLVGVGIGGEF